jgi:hypothetical protein
MQAHEKSGGGGDQIRFLGVSSQGKTSLFLFGVQQRLTLKELAQRWDASVPRRRMTGKPFMLPWPDCALRSREIPRNRVGANLA